MFQSLFKNKILIVALALVVGAVAFYVVTGGSAKGSVDSKPQDIKNRDDVVKALNAYNNFNFAGSILSDPEFKSLEDMTVPIPNTQAGRIDPFAPAN